MPGLNPKQEDIDSFVAITEASQAEAERFLADGVTLEGAIEDYFAAQAAGGGTAARVDEDDEDELDAALAASAAEAEPTGARTLSGAAAEPLPESWRQRGGPRVATLGGNNDDDDDDEPERKPNELYTGGERSGLAVVGPGEDLMQRLQQHTDRLPRDETEAKPNNPWAGMRGGQTLGSEDTPSVPAASSSAPRGGAMPGGFGNFDDEDEDDDEGEDEEEVTRRMIVWRDGFSIEDGPLYRFDNPENQQLLALIQEGRAPLKLFNIKYGQQLRVEVEQRTSEEYSPPPKGPMKAFSGGGNRLGSAVPEAATSSASTTGATSNASTSVPKPASEFNVNPNEPSTSIQVRLADGTRMVARVNLTHTVADLRAFVQASRPDNRPFVLQTTFPSRELPDGETVEEAKLQNAVVVQRFV